MPAKAFFDTNVLLYLISDNAVKSRSAEELLERRGAISVQTLNELVNVTRRRGRLAWKDVHDLLQRVQGRCTPPAAVTANTHFLALTLAERYGYTIYDSLLLASALEQGCDTFYSEDMHDGHSIEGLTIRNPFRKPQ